MTPVDPAGRYRVERELGAGAIKVLKPELGAVLGADRRSVTSPSGLVPRVGNDSSSRSGIQELLDALADGHPGVQDTPGYP